MKYFLVVFFIALIVFGFYRFYTQKEQVFLEEKTISINGKEINVYIADTESERIQGLSGRDSLPGDYGLLFISDYEGIQGIWMKDMNFSIDIAWLDRDKKIVDIKENISPLTYKTVPPQVFYPEKDGLRLNSFYILETNAGFFERAGIKIGDLANF